MNSHRENRRTVALVAGATALAAWTITAAPSTSPRPHTSHALIALRMVVIGALLTLASAGQVPDYSGLAVRDMFARDFPAARDRPNWAYSGPSSLPLPTFLAEHQQCHANMSYVVRRANNPLYIPRREDNPAFTQTLRDVVIGCCDAGYVGCTWPGIDRVIGCCPLGQQCSLRTETRHGVLRPIFVGCVDHVSQKCGRQICPPGHICCPHPDASKSICAPGSPDEPREDVCGPAVDVRPKLHVQPAHVRDYKLYPRGVRKATGNVTIEVVDGMNVTASLADGIFLCPYSRFPCRIGLDHCSLHYDVYTTGINNTLVVTENRTRAIHCCPDTYEVCLRPNTGSFLIRVGCANVLGGEQCCGDQICPAGQQCCPGPALDQPLGGGPRGDHCCSEWETCCYSPTYGSYCGKEVDGDPCGADSRAPPHWWALRPPNP